MKAALKKDIIQWDVQNWGRSLEFWSKHLDIKPESKALALGERDGGLTLWLAQQNYQVTSTDLKGVTPRARELHSRYGISSHIDYQMADITKLAYPSESFDIVIFKSVLGALQTEHLQQQALNEIYRVLKPGGQLLFAENLKGSAFHGWLRKRFVGWSHYWRYINIRETRQLCSAFTSLNLSTFGFLGVFGLNEGQRYFLAYFDKLLCPLIPRNMHYLAYGVATK